MNRPNGFPKSQRLCSRYLIDSLFAPGSSKSLSAFPLRMVYRIEATGEGTERENAEAASAEGSPSAALLISVPKRYFKHAVDRNRVKRQIREAYRNNRNLLRVPEGKRLLIAMIWLDAHHHNSSIVTAKVRNLLQRASENLSRQAPCNINK